MGLGGYTATKFWNPRHRPFQTSLLWGGLPFRVPRLVLQGSNLTVKGQTKATKSVFQKDSNMNYPFWSLPEG